ncbi:hypothetical protein BC831DRAFT_52372 [Entophlyctis helioformis]|nr:hypothetical protein BC831DRAFT_52372 [Entophlyctis helioformis]
MSRGFWAILYPNGLPRSRRSSDGTASRSSKSARRKRPLGSSAASPIAGGGSTRDAVARLRQTSVSAAKLLFNLQSDSDDSSDDYASDSSAQHRRHARRLSRAFSDLDSGMLTDGASSMADSVSSPTSPSSTVHGRSSRPTHSRSKSLSSSAAIHQPQQPHPQQQQHQQHPVLRRLPKDQQQDQQQLEQLDILQQQEKSAQPQRSAPTQRQPSQPSQNQHQKQQPQQQQQQPPEIRLPRRHARSTSQVSLNAQDAPTASHHEPSPVHGRRNPLVSDKPAPADASMPQSALSALLSTSAASESSADTLTVPQAPRGLHARSRSFSSQSTLSSSPRASPHSSPLVTPKAGVDVSAASSSAADSRSSPRLTATRRMSNAPHPSRSPLTLPLALPPAVPITRVPSSSATSAAFPPSSSPPLVFSSLALPATPPSVSAWSSPLNLGNLSNHSPSHTRDTGNSSDSDRSIDHHRNAQQLQQVGKKGKQQAGSKTRKPVAAPNSHGNVSDDQTLSSPNASSQSQSRPASALRERHLSASQRLSGAGAGSSQTHSPSDVESANADVSIIIKAKSPAPRSGVQDQAVVGGVGGAGGGSGGTGAGATAKPAAQQSSAKNGKTATLPSQAATASSVTRTGHSSANPPEPLGEMPGSYPIRRTPSNGVSTSSSSSSSSIGGRSGNNSPSSMASYTMQLRGVQQSEPPKSPSPTRLHRPSAPPGISIRTDLDSIHAKSGPSRMAGHDNGNKKSTGSAGYTPSATTATMAATAAATASAAAAYRLDRDLDGMDADFHSTHAGAGIPRSPASASAPHHHRRVRSALVFSPIAAPTSTPATTVASSALGAQSHLGFSGPPPPGIRHPLQSQYQQRQSLQQQQQQQLEQQQLELQRYYQRQLQYQEEQYQMHLAAQKRAAEHSMVDNLFSPSALLSSSLMSARDSYNSLFESLLQPVPPPQSTTPPVPSPAPPGLAARRRSCRPSRTPTTLALTYRRFVITTSMSTVRSSDPSTTSSITSSSTIPCFLGWTMPTTRSIRLEAWRTRSRPAAAASATTTAAMPTASLGFRAGRRMRRRTRRRCSRCLASQISAAVAGRRSTFCRMGCRVTRTAAMRRLGRAFRSVCSSTARTARIRRMSWTEPMALARGSRRRMAAREPCSVSVSAARA